MPVLNSVSKLEARGPSLCRPPSPLLSSASPMPPLPRSASSTGVGVGCCLQQGSRGHMCLRTEDHSLLRNCLAPSSPLGSFLSLLSPGVSAEVPTPSQGEEVAVSSILSPALKQGPLERKSCGVQLTRNCTPGPFLPLTVEPHRGHDSEDTCLPHRVEEGCSAPSL